MKTCSSCVIVCRTACDLQTQITASVDVECYIQVPKTRIGRRGVGEGGALECKVAVSLAEDLDTSDWGGIFQPQPGSGNPSGPTGQGASKPGMPCAMRIEQGHVKVISNRMWSVFSKEFAFNAIHTDIDLHMYKNCGVGLICGQFDLTFTCYLYTYF